MRNALIGSVVLAALCLMAVGAHVVLAPTRRYDNAAETISNTPERELVLAEAVFRHGDRTPADTFPTDPHINASLSPYGWGHLTNDGKMRMYKTGAYLRTRYDALLGALYAPGSTRAQSTSSERAAASTALVLAALWPPSGTPLEWNPYLDWQPIQVVAEPLNEDTLLLVRKSCPRYGEALEEVMASDEVQQLLRDNAQLLEQLTSYSGLKIKNFDDVQSIYSTLLAEEGLKLKLADWTKYFYPDKLVPLTAESFIINAYTDELKKLKGGHLVKKILGDMKAASSAGSPKIFVYGGHDSTVANLGLALDVWERQIPTYGIMLLLELYRNNIKNEYFVEVYLRNSTRSEPFPLTIPGCSFQCPLTEFESLTKHILPGDSWDEDCAARDPSYVPPPPTGP